MRAGVTMRGAPHLPDHLGRLERERSRLGIRVRLGTDWAGATGGKIPGHGRRDGPAAAPRGAFGSGAHRRGRPVLRGGVPRRYHPRCGGAAAGRDGRRAAGGAGPRGDGRIPRRLAASISNRPAARGASDGWARAPSGSHRIIRSWSGSRSRRSATAGRTRSAGRRRGRPSSRSGGGRRAAGGGVAWRRAPYRRSPGAASVAQSGLGGGEGGADILGCACASARPGALRFRAAMTAAARYAEEIIAGDRNCVESFRR